MYHTYTSLRIVARSAIARMFQVKFRTNSEHLGSMGKTFDHKGNNSLVVFPS
jgi:hypothetical protein